MAAAAALSSSQEHELPLRGHGGHFHLDDPFTPPPSAQAQAHIGSGHSLEPSAFGQLAPAPELQDIDDFDREHAGLQLVPIGTKKPRSDNIVKLQHLCDQKRFQPEYELEEVYPQNFRGRVIVGGESFEDTTLFPSKVQARDAAAKIALERLPATTTPAQAAAGVKRKAAQQSFAPIDRSEDWVSILMLNCQQNKTFEPEYREYQTETNPPRFAYEISLNGGPIAPFKVAGVFPNKSDAKHASAKLAVEWLRSSGHLETPIKRPKPSTTGQNGLPQAFNSVNLELEAPEKSPSIRKRVYELAANLGFRQPSCQPKLCTMNGGVVGSFYNAASIFLAADIAREPLLAGPFRVENVYGQNKAREECCQKVLPVLEEIQRRRFGT